MGILITGVAALSGLYKAPTSYKEAGIGAIVTDELGGEWAYCRAGAAIVNPLDGACCYSQPDDCTPALTAVGSMTIAVTGITPNTSVTKDMYAGGTIIIGAAAAYRRFYYIKSNTASATTTTTLTLYSPVLYAIAGTEWATIVPSPYYDTRPSSGLGQDGLGSVVCMPLQTVTSDYYYWGKIKGQCFGIVVSTVPGAAARDRELVFYGGALSMADEEINANRSCQRAGYLIPRTAGSYGGGDQTFMLQLH